MLHMGKPRMREDRWPETPPLRSDSSISNGDPSSHLQTLLAQLPCGHPQSYGQTHSWPDWPPRERMWKRSTSGIPESQEPRAGVGLWPLGEHIPLEAQNPALIGRAATREGLEHVRVQDRDAGCPVLRAVPDRQTDRERDK